MRKLFLLACSLFLPALLNAQSCSGNAESLFSLTQPHDYVQKRVSSYDRSGGNADARPIPPGADPKEHAWPYMAGWYAEHGCAAFYSNLWKDFRLVAELHKRLQSSSAWQIAATLAS